MKILHVIDSMDMGGAQSLISELAPAQMSLGNEVVVLQLVNTNDKTFVKKLEQSGVKVEALSNNGNVRNPFFIFLLIPYLKKFDIVHVHLFPANYWVAFAKILGRINMPIVTTEHSTDNKRRKIKLFKYIDRFIYKRYQAVIACSDKAKEIFEKHFAIGCLSIPNGVDIHRYLDAIPYKKKELVGISEECFVTTMVARFVWSKRQDTVVRAMKKLPEKHHAVFVGGQESDEGLEKVRKLAQELDVADRVHFLYLRSDVPRILKSSDVIVLSSEYEGLSLSSIEGMASGHPFIASNVDGLREVVSGAGVLVECGNDNELANVINRIDNDKSYRDEIVARCQERARQYDIEKVAQKYIYVYQQFTN